MTNFLFVVFLYAFEIFGIFCIKLSVKRVEHGSLSLSLRSPPCSSSCVCPVAVPGLGLWRWQQFKTWTATKTCQKSAHLKYLPQSPLRGSQPGRGRNCATWKESQGGAGGYDDFASWVRHLAAIWFSCLARRWHPFSLALLCWPPTSHLAAILSSLFVVCSWSPFIWLCVCASVCRCVCCCHVRLSLFIFGSLRCRLLFCSLLLSFDFIACQLLIDIFQQVHKEPTMKWINSAKGPRYNPTPISHREWSFSTLCNRKIISNCNRSVPCRVKANRIRPTHKSNA